jgi:hypothetical protein
MSTTKEDIMIYQIVISFTSFNNSELVSTGQHIVSCMTGNEYFPEPWPDEVPTLEIITNDTEDFAQSVIDAKSGDKVKIATRNQKRPLLIGKFRALGTYVICKAQGDKVKLRSSGFPLRKPLVRHTVTTVPSPLVDPTLKRGKATGQLIFSAKDVEVVDTHEVQIVDTDPTIDSNWKEVGLFPKCSKISIENLTPGKNYWGRIRGINVIGRGPWVVAGPTMAV